jgi:hypothetical protein
MKSIANFKQLTMITIAIFITVALITATSAIMSTNAYAERSMRASSDGGEESTGAFGSDTPWSCASKVLTDSPEGNALGWNPNGGRTIFPIDEPCYLENDSIVLVNVKDGALNFEVCNVDYSTDGFFEVFCNAPPAEGSELRYSVLVQDFGFDVIGAIPTPMKEVPQDILERQQQTNATVTVQ